MDRDDILEKFSREYPWPDAMGIKSLYRFYSFDVRKINRVSSLFSDKKLFHSLPGQFNDPFECRPHFRWPTDKKKIREMRSHLVKILVKQGASRRDARKKVSIRMKDKSFMQTAITESVANAYGDLRICCFTTSKENLLLWSHYANSHTGFCVEFDATKLPISYAYKVKYTKDYPEIEYPRPMDVRAFEPALIKSHHWSYEEEFRTIFTPEDPGTLNTDGVSLILSGDEIKNIYLGANMEMKDREKLIGVVHDGCFKPRIWGTDVSKSSFKLKFTECR